MSSRKDPCRVPHTGVGGCTHKTNRKAGKGTVSQANTGAVLDEETVSEKQIHALWVHVVATSPI